MYKLDTLVTRRVLAGNLLVSMMEITWLARVSDVRFCFGDEQFDDGIKKQGNMFSWALKATHYWSDSMWIFMQFFRKYVLVLARGWRSSLVCWFYDAGLIDFLDVNISWPP